MRINANVFLAYPHEFHAAWMALRATIVKLLPPRLVPQNVTLAYR